MALSKERRDEDHFIWECQTNPNPWDPKEKVQWTPYSSDESFIIEKAYQSRIEEIILNENYRIDLKYCVQKHRTDSHRQRPIRRRSMSNFSSINENLDNQISSSYSKRLSTPLGLANSSNVTTDTGYYGSSFIQTWFFDFNKGKLKITFDQIYPVLLKGLIKEGIIQKSLHLKDIEQTLIEVQEDNVEKTSQKKMEALEICCTRLYTKPCYMYNSVNSALRSNDKTKLNTLGPYAYVLSNFIGRNFQNKPSFLDKLRRIIPKNEFQQITLYRGDKSFDNNTEKYCAAIGDHSKHFKWLQFVSTSRNPDIALRFHEDILYKIHFHSYSSIEDQIPDISIYSEIKCEEEILLLLGVIFTIEQVYFDDHLNRYIIHIQIHSSYIYKLQ